MGGSAISASDHHTSATSPLVGRDAEIAVLLAAYKQAAAGNGSIVLVRGDGGIGKSWLCAEALRRAIPMGAAVMSGHAAQTERGVPYALFRDLVASLPGDLPDDLEARAAELDALLDVNAPQGGRRARHPRGVLGAALELVGRLADHQPLIMVWEDVHVADADSISLFVRMARRLSTSRVLLIGSVRPHSSAQTVELERLVEQLAIDGRGVLVDLGPLDRSDVRALVAVLIKMAPDQATVDLVFESSRGNPFFATETTRSLLASASIAADETKARLVEHHRVLRPRTAVVHRFFQIGSTEAQLARVLSAFGRISLRQLPLVASIMERSEDTVIDGFDRLVAEHLLVRRSDGRYEFAHSILREALYEDVGPAEQRRLHRRIADNLERERSQGVAVDITELATHVAECADPGDATAAALLADAGRATARTAPLVSAGWFAKSAGLLPTGSAQRPKVIALQAASMFRASLPHEAARLGQEALAHLSAGPARTRALTVTVNSLYICADLRTAVDVIDEEQRRFGVLSRPLLALRAHFLTELGIAVDGETDHARATPEANEAEMAIMLTHDLYRAGLRGDAPTVDRLFDDLARVGRTGSRQTQLATLSVTAVESVFIGHLDRATAALTAAAELRRHDRGLSIGGQLETAAIVLAFLRGRWDAVVADLADLTWELDHNQARILEGWVQYAACEIHLARGELRRAAEIAAGFRWHIEPVRQATDATAAKVALAQGDVGVARARLESARARIAANGLRYGLDGILEVLIDACLTDSDHRAALEHLVQLEEQAARTGWSLSGVRAQLARARVTDDVNSALAAHKAADTIGLPFQRARASLLAGTLGADARDHLTTAYQTFDELGALPWRQRAAVELRARRFTVPRRTADPGSALSETESTLAAMVSEGLTNREIASTLHYSVKTIEVYLTRLYAKTNTRSRFELARAVERGDVR